MRTEQIVNQIVLAASWDFAEDRLDPVDAAAELLGISTTDARLDAVRTVVEAAADHLTWEEQVGLVAHTLLARQAVEDGTRSHDVPLAAAA